MDAGGGGVAISFKSGILDLAAILTARYHLASLRGRFEACGIYFNYDKEIARQDRCYYAKIAVYYASLSIKRLCDVIQSQQRLRLISPGISP